MENKDFSRIPSESFAEKAANFAEKLFSAPRFKPAEKTESASKLGNIARVFKNPDNVVPALHALLFATLTTPMVLGFIALQTKRFMEKHSAKKEKSEEAKYTAEIAAKILSPEKTIPEKVDSGEKNFESVFKSIDPNVKIGYRTSSSGDWTNYSVEFAATDKEAAKKALEEKFPGVNVVLTNHARTPTQTNQVSLYFLAGTARCTFPTAYATSLLAPATSTPQPSPSTPKAAISNDKGKEPERSTSTSAPIAQAASLSAKPASTESRDISSEEGLEKLFREWGPFAQVTEDEGYFLVNAEVSAEATAEATKKKLEDFKDLTDTLGKISEYKEHKIPGSTDKAITFKILRKENATPEQAQAPAPTAPADVSAATSPVPPKANWSDQKLLEEAFKRFDSRPIVIGSFADEGAYSVSLDLSKEEFAKFKETYQRDLSNNNFIYRDNKEPTINSSGRFEVDFTLSEARVKTLTDEERRK